MRRPPSAATRRRVPDMMFRPCASIMIVGRRDNLAQPNAVVQSGVRSLKLADSAGCAPGGLRSCKSKLVGEAGVRFSFCA